MQAVLPAGQFRRAEITFIEDDGRRNRFLLDLFQKGEIFRGHTDGAIHNEDGNVGFV